jgi:hypothetical protein
VSEIPDSFDPSGDSLTPGRGVKSRNRSRQIFAPRSSWLAITDPPKIYLNNMAFDVTSQSLGMAESILEQLNMTSRAGSLLRVETSELNTSKRKPSTDSSDESEVALGHDRSFFFLDMARVRFEMYNVYLERLYFIYFCGPTSNTWCWRAIEGRSETL